MFYCYCFMHFEFLLDFSGFEYFIGLLLSAEAAIENYTRKNVFLKLGKIFKKYVLNSRIFSKVVP